ncbi:ribonuclease D [Chloroflexota bacterium]
MEHKSSIPIELLTTSRQVSDLARILFQERCIALDTESNSRHRYPERVCLVQVATNSKVYLIDTLAVNDMKPIGEILADETVVKVIQGADYDIRCLDREWGFRVLNLFDTSIAARFVGMKQTGLSALTEALLEVQVLKDTRIQKSDWSHRPLSQKALHYAAMDVWYLLSIQRALESRLRILARSLWVSEECARLEEIRYVAPDLEAAFLSLKGSHKLDGQAKAILKRLFMLREAEARRRNRPPYYVLSHETLVYLASNPAVDLVQLPGLRRQVDSSFGRLLRVTLDRGLADPPISNPNRYSIQPVTPIEIERLQILKKWRVNLGRQLSIDPALVWPMVSLERLSKAPRTLGAEIQSPEVRQWQREQCATSLETALV